MRHIVSTLIQLATTEKPQALVSLHLVTLASHTPRSEQILIWLDIKRPSSSPLEFMTRIAFALIASLTLLASVPIHAQSGSRGAHQTQNRTPTARATPKATAQRANTARKGKVATVGRNSQKSRAQKRPPPARPTKQQAPQSTVKKTR